MGIWAVIVVMAFLSVAANVVSAVVFYKNKAKQAKLKYCIESQHHKNYDNDNQNQNQVIRNRNDNRKSRPGDKCWICLQVMTRETISFMNCGHAVHYGDCFDDYRRTRRDCSFCGKIVLRLDLPGANCAICSQPMEEYDMKYVKCEHAFHLYCLIRNNRSITDKCPGCSIQIIPRNA